MDILMAIATGAALQFSMEYQGLETEVQFSGTGFEMPDTAIAVWSEGQDTVSIGTLHVGDQEVRINWTLRAVTDSIWHVDSTTVHSLARKLKKMPPMVPTMPRMIALPQPVRLATCYENEYFDCWGK